MRRTCALLWKLSIDVSTMTPCSGRSSRASSKAAGTGIWSQDRFLDEPRAQLEQYRGNVQKAHRPLADIEPRHFARWLSLFLNTVETRYEPAVAVQFMEPALRIAHSLQLSKFGWDYQIPAEQQALIEALRRQRSGSDEPQPRFPERPAGEPFPAKFVGRDAS